MSLLLLGGGVLATRYLIKNLDKTIQTAEGLEITPEFFHIDKDKTSLFSGVVGTIGLKIYNKSEKSITYQKFVGQIMYNKQRVGSIDSSLNQKELKPRSNTLIKVQTTLPFSFFGTQVSKILSDLLSGKKIAFSKTVTLNGFIKLSGLPNSEINKTFDLGKISKI